MSIFMCFVTDIYIYIYIYVCVCVCVCVLIYLSPDIYIGDRRDLGLIPGSGRSLGGGHGNPLQHSWLENLMDRGA